MIRIRGARQHNLQNLTLDIPSGQLVVVTGPSGSGKSSLAFATLFAEGQRRFVESLSVYARQFVDQLERPEVDGIDGLHPAIAIEQHSGGLNPRSTVATATELYEHLRVLWAAAGVPHDPATGERLTRMGAEEIVAALAGEAEGTRVVVLAPLPQELARDTASLLGDLRRQGFVRVRVNGEMLDLDEAEAQWPAHVTEVEIVVDRLIVRPGAEARLADSIETSLRICGLESRALVRRPGQEGWLGLSFQTSYRNPKTGFTMSELRPQQFSFNSHLGACPACEGLGFERFCDPDLLVPEPEKPLLEAVQGWWKPKGRRASMWHQEARALLRMFGAEETTPFAHLPKELKQLLFHGGPLETGWKLGSEKRPQVKKYVGLCVEAERKLPAAHSEAVRRRLLRVMGTRACRVCRGQRLKPEILAVKLEGAKGRWLGIQDFCDLTVEDATSWLKGVKFPAEREEPCRHLAEELREKLGFLERVGLDYLSLNRASGTLSGGEAQRIRLATQLGSGLTGVLYVLDEPSIGLHPEDIGKLIETLKELRDRGNTVVVVEHDQEMIRAADWMVELGPRAGSEGGRLLANGPLAEITHTPTSDWLARPAPELPPSHGGYHWLHELVIRGAREHNLQNIDVHIPLGALTCLCGPSGSGKSTLADDILMRAMRRHFHGAAEKPGMCDGIDGFEQIDKAVVIDQAPIGRSPRSNPATFTGVFDLIRALFAKLPLSRQRGYGAGRFSFNLAGGRCDRCAGAGRLKVEMHFLPDAWVVCGACGGRRFNRETLEVTYKGLSIASVLERSVREAQELFAAVPKLARILRVLDELGLGYLKLGQPANTLSGGEAQRLKLAVELARPTAERTFYFLDEPTTGLGFRDVERLVTALLRLRDDGHSVLVVEHQLDVMRAADWIIDLGPGGGKRGGKLMAAGTPREIAANPDSPSGRALAKIGTVH